MSAPANPYQTPSAEVSPSFGDGQVVGNAIAMRNEYLRHEAGVRSIGILYYISSAMFAALIFAGLAMSTENPGGGFGMVGIGAVFAAIFIWMGMGIRKLNPRVRTAVGITSGIGLLNLPIGTLINLYILYLVFGAKGKVVFSEEYARVCQQTPDIKYQTPLFVKILVLLLLALVIAGVLAATMGS